MSKLSAYGKVTRENLAINNPVLIQVLGICSMLAVTNVVINTLIMSIGLAFVTAFSSLVISLIRGLIPSKIRMIVQLVVGAFFVVILSLILQAFVPKVARELGPYIGLILTNCILMGRTEGFALANKPLIAWWDGFTSGLGYMAVLLTLALVREPLAFGTIAGFPIFPPEYQAGGYNWTIMVMAPSAFFLIAIMIWVFKSYNARKTAAAKAPMAPGAAPTPAGGKA